MTYEGLALMLAVVGLALIFTEIMLPSLGFLTFLCAVAFISSIWCGYKAWWVTSPNSFWMFIGALAVLVPGAIFGLFRTLDKTSLGDRVLLPIPSSEQVTPHQAEVRRLSSFIGMKGVALNLMTPGGMVQVAGERLHAQSEGLLIQPETPVEVIAVKGTRVIVRAVTSGSASQPVPSPIDPWLAESDAPPESPLDFDFPQS
ncbi:MAG: NfeD family protein [Planctomycetaceae bacterium]